MLQGWPVKPDRLSLLAAEKHYFQLDAAGRLQYYLYTETGKHREKLSGDLFRQKVDGFDAAVDPLGVIHLLGYGATTGLFYLTLPPAGQDPPLLLYRDPHKTIDHVSACRDQKNNLHLLFLARSERYKMWWLFYLGGKQQDDGLRRWMEPAVIDFGYGPPEQYGLIGTDLKDRLFVLYRLFGAGRYNLAFRRLEGNPSRLDKTIFPGPDCVGSSAEPPYPGKTVFPQEIKGEREKTECYFPSFLIDADNTLHLAWLGHRKKTMFLYYARCNPAGVWGDYFSLEIAQDSFFWAPLFRYGDNLFLTWKKGDTIFHLYSAAKKQEKPEKQGGKGRNQKGKQKKRGNQGQTSWQWGKKQTVPKGIQLLRLRPAGNPAENMPCEGFWGLSFFAAAGDPLQGMLQPDDFAARDLEKVNKTENIEEDVSLGWQKPPELHTLDLLTSYTLARAGNLQATNVFLKRKMEGQSREFSRLYNAGLAQKDYLEEKLASKEVELEKVEKLLQDTIAGLQKRLRQQDEDIMNLRAELRALLKENEELKRNESAQATKLARFIEEIERLTGEIEAAQGKKIKKTSFLEELLHKIRRQPPPGSK